MKMYLKEFGEITSLSINWVKSEMTIFNCDKEEGGGVWTIFGLGELCICFASERAHGY